MTGRKLADVEDLPEDGSRVIVEVDGREIAVFRVDGEYHAVANYCVHAGGPLCEGNLTGQMTPGDGWNWDYDDRDRVVVCPWHSWKFDVTTGLNVDSDRYAVPTYEVEPRDGGIYLIE